MAKTLRPICLHPTGRWTYPKRSDVLAVPGLVLDGDIPAREELQVLSSQLQAPLSLEQAPVLRELWGGLARVWSFPKGKTSMKQLHRLGRRLFFSFELPYAYQEGTTLQTEIQFLPLNEGEGDVVWRLFMNGAAPSQRFPDEPFSLSIIGHISQKDFMRHMALLIETEFGAKFTNNTIVLGSIMRDTGSPADTYEGAVGLLACDTKMVVNEIGHRPQGSDYEEGKEKREDHTK